jgi:DHA1 family bicyclomycin/chloramphenicol resistance-like MFS transporter
MNRTPLILFLAALSALAAFSTDIYLASMPVIQRLFHTSVATMQLTLSLFFIGFAIMQLVWGPLSDRMGRKPILFIGLCIFTLGCLLSALSHNMTWLLIGRVIQAIGACSGIVAALSIIRDTFENAHDMAKALSSVAITMMIAPMIAPIIGSFLLAHINWEANFYFLAIGGIILLISTFFARESHPKQRRKPLPANQLLHAYWQQIKCRPFLLATIATSTNFAIMFSFISSSAFIYIKTYHLAPADFGYFFALNAVALILGSLFLRLRKGKTSDKKITAIAITCSLSGSIFLLITLQLFPASIWSVATPCFITTLGVGILFPEANTCALKNVVSFTGLASSLIGTTRFVLAAIVGYIMGLAATHSAMPLAISMLTLSVLTACFMWLYFHAQARDPV